MRIPTLAALAVLPLAFTAACGGEESDTTDVEVPNPDDVETPDPEDVEVPEQDG